VPPVTVNGYLSTFQAEAAGVLNHALHHTGDHPVLQYTHDLHAVRDLLGHAEPRNTARA